MGKGGLVLDIGQLNERKISTGWGYGEKELRLVCFTSKDYGKKKKNSVVVILAFETLQ
jgi:hypothetical protein